MKIARLLFVENLFYLIRNTRHETDGSRQETGDRRQETVEIRGGSRETGDRILTPGDIRRSINESRRQSRRREGRKEDHANTSIAAGVMRDICMIPLYGGYM